MKVLVACEFSGIVRDAFAARGHDAWSCDLQPSEQPGQHLQGDILDFLDHGWDLMIAHPPCTYLSAAGLHYCQGFGPQAIERRQKREQAAQFVHRLFSAPIDKIAIENPVGWLSTVWRKPDQTVRMCDFGENAIKPTCLWLKNLPPLVGTKTIEPSRRGKRTSEWYSRLRSPKERSRTFYYFAGAMADQWGGYCTSERKDT